MLLKAYNTILIYSKTFKITSVFGVNRILLRHFAIYAKLGQIKKAIPYFFGMAILNVPNR